MAAVDSLCVQPYVSAAGGFCGELIVLSVAAPDRYLKAVGGHKAHGTLLFTLALLCAALLFYIARADELRLYLGKVVLCLGAFGFIEDAVEIFKLPLPLGYERGEMLLGCLQLVIFLEHRSSVCLRRF